LALLGKYDKNAEPSEKKSKKEAQKKGLPIIKPDTWIEAKVIRSYAESLSSDSMFLFYDVYKKAHGMASYT
jgi:hypothetical protein